MFNFIRNLWSDYLISRELQRYVLDCLKLSNNPQIKAQRAIIRLFLEEGNLREFTREEFVQFLINYGRTLAYVDMSKVIKGNKEDVRNLLVVD